MIEYCMERAIDRLPGKWSGRPVALRNGPGWAFTRVGEYEDHPLTVIARDDDDGDGDWLILTLFVRKRQDNVIPPLEYWPLVVCGPTEAGEAIASHLDEFNDAHTAQLYFTDPGVRAGVEGMTCLL